MEGAFCRAGPCPPFVRSLNKGLDMPRTLPNPRWFTFALSAFLIPASAAIAVQEVRDVVSDADDDWYDAWREERERIEELVSSAYGLDDDLRASLHAEMEARVVQQREYEAKMQAELAILSAKMAEQGVDTSDADNPLVDEFARKWWQMTQSMPLYDSSVSAWVAERVPPEVAAEGRKRFEDLQERYMLSLAREREVAQAGPARKAAILQESRELNAPLNREHSRPLPDDPYIGEIAEMEDRLAAVDRQVMPNRPSRKRFRDAAEAKAAPGVVAPPPVPQPYPAASPQPAATPPSHQAAPQTPRPVVTPPTPAHAAPQQAPAQPPKAAAPPPPPAPPLDEWDKHLMATAQKYGFDDRQLTNARSILSDLRKRAYQYQTSRADDYARAELLTDAKARTEQLKALNKPFDALFEELKQRLESLPTATQRQKAGGAANASPKK